MIVRIGLSLVIVLLLSGCSSVHVNRSNSLSAAPKGIPFYAKTAVCKQETVWLEPQYIITFENQATSYGPVQATMSREEYLRKETQDFIAQAGGTPADWMTLTAAAKGPVQFDEGATCAVSEGQPACGILAQEKKGNWFRVANTGTVDVIVDYSNVFYLNSSRPVAGTTQVDAKLGSDGTLSEGSAQVNDQTLATIASTIASLAGSASTAAKIGGFAAAEEAKKKEVHVTVSTKFYRHTHTQYLQTTVAATPAGCAPADSGILTGSFVVSDAEDPATKKPAGSEGSTISVSGSIVLPKAAAPAGQSPAPGAPPTPPKKP